MVKRVHIYDMDGTIVCSMHRYRTKVIDEKITIDFPYWLENEHRAERDSLLPLARQYRSDLENPAIFVIIATARFLSEPDYNFINSKLGNPDAIISRSSREDNRPGAMLKIDGLKKVFSAANLWNVEKIFWEDNFHYLTKVCGALGIKGRFVKSNQGW